MPAWSHLPNAVHIDRILESLHTHPGMWYVATGVTLDSVWHNARDIAWDDDVDDFWSDVWDAAWSADWPIIDRPSDAAIIRAQRAGTAILALITWPHSAALLDMPTDAVRVLAALGDDAAVLLLPAVIVLHCDTAET